MLAYDLYALKFEKLDDARVTIEALLSITFGLRDTIYYRSPCFTYGQIGEESFDLQINLDPFEDVPNEDDFPDHHLLLYINRTSRSNELRDRLSGADKRIVLLRHELF